MPWFSKGVIEYNVDDKPFISDFFPVEAASKEEANTIMAGIKTYWVTYVDMTETTYGPFDTREEAKHPPIEPEDDDPFVDTPLYLPSGK